MFSSILKKGNSLMEVLKVKRLLIAFFVTVFFFMFFASNNNFNETEYFEDLGYTTEISEKFSNLSQADKGKLLSINPTGKNFLILCTVKDNNISKQELNLLNLCQQNWPNYTYSRIEAEKLHKYSFLENFDTVFKFPFSVSEITEFNFEPEMFKEANVTISDKPSNNDFIPILMYHMIDEPKNWISLDGFKQQLSILYSQGFSTLAFTDFLNLDFSSIPTNRKPVILTFDDGWSSQFDILENGSLNPNCALGVLEDFYKDHPNFGHNAIFFINFYPTPFSTKKNINYSWQNKLKILASMGYEIGNHTYSHVLLYGKPHSVVKEELNLWYSSLENVISIETPGASILNYPGGAIPSNLEYISEYSYKNINIEAACIAWGGPSYLPSSTYFNKYRITRINATTENVRYISTLNSYKKPFVLNVNIPNFIVSNPKLLNSWLHRIYGINSNNYIIQLY
jgi:peptidoglycan/xylan/chitin deacetylase (PgdA/CDA1 family)